MTNVLPPNDRKLMWVYYRNRFLLVGSAGLIFVALVGLIALAPSYIILAANAPIGADTHASSTDIALERADAQRAQAQISQLLPFVASTSSPMEIISRAVSLKPVGISILQISYSGDPGATIVTLTGTTKGRAQVDEYRRALGASGVYKSVSVPVTDLVGINGDQFTVTLALPPQ